MTEPRRPAVAPGSWSDPARELIRAETQAALAAIAGADLEAGAGLEAWRMAQIIEWIGDGVRLGVPVPVALRRWLEKRPAAELHAVIEVAHQAAGELPAFTSPPEPDDGYLVEEATRGRDRAESLKVGILRACVARGVAPVTLAGFGAWCERLREAERSFAVVGREVVLATLGSRRWMLEHDDWTATLASRGLDPDEASAPGELAPTDDEAAAVGAVLPPPSAVVAYVTRGVLARWIEKVADADAEFATLLEDAIDDLGDEPMQSLVARQWLARRRRGETIALPLRPPRLAHASTPHVTIDDDPVVVRLGRLHPVAAEGRLLGYPDALELRVTSEEGAVRAVELGDRRVEHADADGVWVVRVEGMTGGTDIVLAVDGARGERCEARLRIDDAT